MKRTNERYAILKPDGSANPVREYGKFGTGEPNFVPDEVPPFDWHNDEHVNYMTWMYRDDFGKGFTWHLIDSRPMTKADAAESIKRQCRAWGIKYVARQWAIVKTTTSIVREVA